MKPDITFTRRTLLTRARYDALVSKLATVYEDVAAELHEDPATIDKLLTQMAAISSQATNSTEFPFFPQPTDDADTLHVKSIQWLNGGVDPEWVIQWWDTVRQLNGTWANSATSPIPLEATADPNS